MLAVWNLQTGLASACQVAAVLSALPICLKFNSIRLVNELVDLSLNPLLSRRDSLLVTVVSHLCFFAGPASSSTKSGTAATLSTKKSILLLEATYAFLQHMEGLKDFLTFTYVIQKHHLQPK